MAPFLLKFKNYPTEWYHNVLGHICTLLTLGLYWIFAYGYFFNRQEYHNRKIFYRYIKQYGLKDNYTITYRHDNFVLICIDDYEICLHKTGKWYIADAYGTGIVMSHFHSGILDTHRYKYIQKELMKELYNE